MIFLNIVRGCKVYYYVVGLWGKKVYIEVVKLLKIIFFELILLVLLEELVYDYILEFDEKEIDFKVVYVYVIINNIIEGILFYDIFKINGVFVIVDMFFNILVVKYKVEDFVMIYVGV